MTFDCDFFILIIFFFFFNNVEYGWRVKYGVVFGFLLVFPLHFTLIFIYWAAVEILNWAILFYFIFTVVKLYWMTFSKFLVLRRSIPFLNLDNLFYFWQDANDGKRILHVSDNSMYDASRIPFAHRIIDYLTPHKKTRRSFKSPKQYKYIIIIIADLRSHLFHNMWQSIFCH